VDLPTRREILEALLAQLEAATFPGETAPKITYWDTFDQDYKGPPTVTVRDEEETTEKIDYIYQNTLTVEVEAIAYTTPANKLGDASDWLEAIKTAVVREAWAPTPVFVRPTGTTKAIGEGGKIAFRVTLNAEIVYRDPV
jgi:hypothetical protein